MSKSRKKKIPEITSKQEAHQALDWIWKAIPLPTRIRREEPDQRQALRSKLYQARWVQKY